MSEDDAAFKGNVLRRDWASDPVTPFTMDMPLFGPVHVPNHGRAQCHPNHCPLHNPSDSHMKDWELHWHTEKAQFERFCPHGIGHPDVDDTRYQEGIGRDRMDIHRCDGCCSPKEVGD